MSERDCVMIISPDGTSSYYIETELLETVREILEWAEELSDNVIVQEVDV